MNDAYASKARVSCVTNSSRADLYELCCMLKPNDAVNYLSTTLYREFLLRSWDFEVKYRQHEYR